MAKTKTGFGGSLQSLRRLLLHRAEHQWSVKSKEFAYKLLSRMKFLEDLNASELLDLTEIWELHELLPTLRTVTFFKVAPLLKVFNINDSTLVGVNPTIRTLKFTRHQSDKGDRLFRLPSVNSAHHRLKDVLLALSLFPNLEYLALIGITRPDDASLPIIPNTPTFPDQGFALMKLCIPDSTNLMPLLYYIPNLRTLKINHLTGEAFGALASNCKHLRVLEWMNKSNDVFHSRPEPDGLHRFLVSCSSLKVLNGIRQFIKADDMIREPWACRRIEVLRCRVVGIKRFNEEPLHGIVELATEYSPELMVRDQSWKQMHKSYHEQQRSVYKRLADLKHLKQLDLGLKNRRPGALYRFLAGVESAGYPRYYDTVSDTLEISLESGLDELRTLKNLEMFGFEGANHCIQERELGWMARSWPKLKLMYGLAEDHPRYTNGWIDSDKKKELRKYMQALRPDVKHGSTLDNSR
ncbi:hypothetical protein BGX34_009007 [Mortierella sp. NVP85]|nr:hypothetical protein BGX34_009007 [Mortierella sp. NVP85]